MDKSIEDLINEINIFDDEIGNSVWSFGLVNSIAFSNDNGETWHELDIGELKDYWPMDGLDFLDE